MSQSIVDSHIHFWDPDLLQYDWLSELPAINKPFLPADLLAQATAVNLEKFVFVQADCRPEQGFKEVAWVSSLAETEARLQGIVAYAPLEKGQAASPYLTQLTRFRRVKGVRRLIQSEAPGFCVQPDFIQAVRLLPEFGFSFDLCIRQPQLGDVLTLVERCPEVQFVLDHIGKPDIEGGRFQPWQAQIDDLAQLPNVTCKISGLVTEAGWHSWTAGQLQPFIDHVIDVFGSGRVMYGGDWPVSLLATTYQGWIDTLAGAVANLTDQDKQKLFFENAASFYRLDE